jgi:hypothetical protein
MCLHLHASDIHNAKADLTRIEDLCKILLDLKGPKNSLARDLVRLSLYLMARSTAPCYESAKVMKMLRLVHTSSAFEADDEVDDSIVVDDTFELACHTYITTREVLIRRGHVVAPLQYLLSPFKGEGIRADGTPRRWCHFVEDDAVAEASALEADPFFFSPKLFGEETKKKSSAFTEIRIKRIEIDILARDLLEEPFEELLSDTVSEEARKHCNSYTI